MTADIAAVALLSLVWVALMFLPGGRGAAGLRERMDGARAALAATGRALLHLRRDPCVRLAFLGCLMLCANWAALTYRVGWAAVTALLNEQAPPPDPRETEACHRMLRSLSSVYWGGAHAPGQRLPEEMPPCPRGGRYRLDLRGRLECSIHGRPPDADPGKDGPGGRR